MFDQLNTKATFILWISDARAAHSSASFYSALLYNDLGDFYKLHFLPIVAWS